MTAKKSGGGRRSLSGEVVEIEEGAGYHLHRFGSRRVLMDFVANLTAASFSEGVSPGCDTAVVALAGGTTPLPVYERLAKDAAIAWDKAVIFPTDERCVAADDPRRNSRMLREALGARVIDLAEGATVAEMIAANLPPALAGALLLRAGGYRRIDFALLGMGADGHIASIFPDALPAGDDWTVVRTAPASQPEERLSLPLSVLATATVAALLIVGRDKLAAFEAAVEDELSPIGLLTRLREEDDEPAVVFYAD